MNMLGKKINIVVVFMIIGWIVSGSFCRKGDNLSNDSSFSNDPVKKNQIILRVGESFYFNSDFEKYAMLAAGKDSSLSIESLSRLLDNFIEDKLLLEAAKEKGIEITFEEIKQYLAKTTSGIDSTGRISEQDPEAYANLREGLLIEEYIYQLIRDIEVEEEEIKAYYESNKREFLRPKRVKVSQILVKTENKAVDLFNKLKGADEDKFKETAMAESIAAEASRGGEMGTFEMGQLPYEFDKVVFSLDEGELSQVVESSYGYHIFRIDKIFPAELVPLERASEEIKIIILERKVKEFLLQHIEELKDSLDWQFFPDNLSFPYQRKTYDNE